MVQEVELFRNDRCAENDADADDELEHQGSLAEQVLFPSAFLCTQDGLYTFPAVISDRYGCHESGQDNDHRTAEAGFLIHAHLGELDFRYFLEVRK